jgi:hypothetical protein
MSVLDDGRAGIWLGCALGLLLGSDSVCWDLVVLDCSVYSPCPLGKSLFVACRCTVLVAALARSDLMYLLV